MYYNTNSTAGDDLVLFRSKTITQDQKVLQIFRNHADLTAEECLDRFSSIRTPLTSIRRSITDLTKEGKLIFTGEMRPGSFGRMTRVFKIVER